MSTTKGKVKGDCDRDGGKEKRRKKKEERRRITGEGSKKK